MISYTRKIVWLILLLTPIHFSSVNHTRPNFCNVYGITYQVSDPHRADFHVYEEETEGSADILIYETEDKLFADRSGLWHFTDVEAFADFKVYFGNNRGTADFTVYFIDVESFAGCNR